MTISLAPVNFVHIAYLSVSLFGLLLIFGKKQYKALALLLAAHAIQQLFNLLEELGISSYLVTPAIQMAYGPLYYLFVKNLVYGNLDVKKSLVHLLPAVIGLAVTTWWPVVLQAAFVWLIVYFWLAFRLLRHYHHLLAEVTSDTDRHALTWLMRVFTVIFVLEFIDFTRLNLQLALDYHLLVDWYFVSALLSLAVTVYLVLKAIRQPTLYAGIAELEQRVSQGTSGEVEQARAVFESIDQHVRQTLAYRRPKYALRDLAGELGLTDANVSWAINQGGGQSFSDYINAFRIAEVKQTISHAARQQTLLDIAFEAGFSSKSSFNAVFKRHTGVTPSQYAKKDS